MTSQDAMKSGTKALMMGQITETLMALSRAHAAQHHDFEVTLL